jgi:hypothetical protein
MSNRYRRLLSGGLGLVAIFIGYEGFQRFRVDYPDRTHAMNELHFEAQTFCVGRFLVDLPKGSKIVSARGSGGPADYVSEYPVNRAEFQRRIAERWVDLEARKADANGSKYVQPSKRSEPVPDSALFTYEYVMLSGRDVNGVERDRLHYETEGYLWRNGILYSFTDHSPEQLVVETMRLLTAWPNDQVPAEPGFCGPMSFFSGGTKAESVSMMFRLPTKPELAFGLQTTTFPAVDDYLRPKARRPNLKAFESATFRSTTHRDAKRSVAQMPGEELVVGMTELKAEKYHSDVIARWFYAGTPDSSGKPSIEAKLEVVYQTTEAPSPWGGFPRKSPADEVGEGEFMAYWDTMLDTLRLRPGALRPGDK